MIFETYKVADISTRYLAESDLELLLRTDCPTRFGETDGGFGTFHWVPDDDELFREDMERAAQFGLSDRFVAIMRGLRAARVPYVRFDADGGEIQSSENDAAISTTLEIGIGDASSDNPGERIEIK